MAQLGRKDRAARLPAAVSNLATWSLITDNGDPSLAGGVWISSLILKKIVEYILLVICPC